MASGGCTEMERLHPSNTWDILPPQDLALEERLNDIFKFDEHHFFQSGWMKQEIKERWIRRAIEIGDPTAHKIVKRHCSDSDAWNKLVVNSITYHEVEDGSDG